MTNDVKRGSAGEGQGLTVACYTCKSLFMDTGSEPGPAAGTEEVAAMADIEIPLDNIRIKEIDLIEVEAELTGDPARPIATLLTGDTAKPITTQLQGDPAKPITTQLQGDPAKPITTQLQGDPAKPIAATVEVLNIPRLSLEDIKDLMTPEIRIRMPNYEQLCLKLFGVEILSLCLSGELQTITEPYVPNRFERCDLGCPDLDTRPFPDDTGTHGRRT